MLWVLQAMRVCECWNVHLSDSMLAFSVSSCLPLPRCQTVSMPVEESGVMCDVSTEDASGLLQPRAVAVAPDGTFLCVTDVEYKQALVSLASLPLHTWTHLYHSFLALPLPPTLLYASPPTYIAPLAQPVHLHRSLSVLFPATSPYSYTGVFLPRWRITAQTGCWRRWAAEAPLGRCNITLQRQHCCERQ